MILDKLAAGETVEQLLEAHPRLTREGVQAAFAFAAATLRSDIDYAVKNDVTRYPLRSKPIRYSDPFDSVVEDDWQKMRVAVNISSELDQLFAEIDQHHYL